MLLVSSSNYTDREALRWGAVGVAHGQTWENPDVARPKQTHFSCLSKQELCFLIGAIRQQDPRVHLWTEMKFFRGYAEKQKESLNM